MAFQRRWAIAVSAFVLSMAPFSSSGLPPGTDGAVDGVSAEVTTGQAASVSPGESPGGVEAHLLSSLVAAVPGKPFLVGVEILMEEGWHTYWENGGDAGFPTTIEWQLPDGWTHGPILWPTPHRYAEEGDIVTFGYHDRVLLLTELKPGTSSSAGRAEIRARVDWLQCKELCIPGGADVSAMVTLSAEEAPAATSILAAFDRAKSELPVDASGLPEVSVRALQSVDAIPPGESATMAFVLEGVSTTSAEKATFLPRPSRELVLRDAVFYFRDGVVALTVPIQVMAEVAPASACTLSAVCSFPREGLPPLNLRIDAPVAIAAAAHAPIPSTEPIFVTPESGPFLSTTSVQGQPTDLAASGSAAATKNPAALPAPRSLAHFLVLAFLGGIILNVMPCVLPVISLKIMSFAKNANEDPKKLFRLGLAFAAGVLFSFLLLAGAVIALQTAGEMIGWGFQFQSPGFVAALAAIIFLFALSLLGLFEVHIPLGALARGGGRAYVDDFMNGMLATLLATPCTAPMLGPAVAFAFSQPPAVVVAIFVCVGLGLSVPYVLLTMNPRLLRFVPAPGAWMVTFKEIMGFILLATLIWLLSVFGTQTGIPGVTRLLFFLLALGVLAWIHGRFVTLSTAGSARLAIWGATLVAVGICYQQILKDAITLEPRADLGRPTAAFQSSGSGEDDVIWEPFTTSALEEAVSKGQTVFIDFTAEWCLTCKVNEKTVLADEEVEKLFLEYDVVTLKGDWTRKDPEITSILQRHGRAGVPFYAVYPANKVDGVIVLPELINKKLVLESLRQAGPSRAPGA